MTKFTTVGGLRKSLEGLPDEMLVVLEIQPLENEELCACVSGGETALNEDNELCFFLCADEEEEEEEEEPAAEPEQ
jgi:hypothetical protein